MLIEEALGSFYLSMEGALAPKTVRFYQDRLKSLANYFQGRKVKTLTSGDLNCWRASLAAKRELYQTGNHKRPRQAAYSPFTMHQYVRSCRRFFRWLEEEGKIESNPARRLRLPELPTHVVRGIGEGDRDKLLADARRNPRNYAILMILADTGCRVGGLVGLRLQDLDLDNRCAVVREKGKGGSQKERMIFFIQRTVEAIRCWLEIRPALPGIDQVFLSHAHRQGYRWHPLTENGVRTMLKQLARKAGVSARCNPHSFRHGAIRGMLARSMPLPAASQLAGHSSVTVTGDIYGTYPPDLLQEMHDKASWLLPRH